MILAANNNQMWELACLRCRHFGISVNAMQAPRCISDTRVMLSQASQLPQAIFMVLR